MGMGPSSPSTVRTSAWGKVEVQAAEMAAEMLGHMLRYTADNSLKYSLDSFIRVRSFLPADLPPDTSLRARKKHTPGPVLCQ